MLEDTKEAAPPTTTERIERFERRLQVKLPADYRKFLLKFNGGRPFPSHFVQRRESSPQWTRIHFFFGLDDPERSCDLDWNYEVMRDRLPSRVLPIASDEGGNLFCMDMRSSGQARIVFWDHELEDQGPRIALSAVIASSFDEWLAQLSHRA